MSFNSVSESILSGRDDWSRFGSPGRERVLLRGPEVCAECGATFISLYPLKFCSDHDGLDEL